MVTVSRFMLILGLSSCGASEDSKDTSQDLNESVAAKLRTTWANKDLAIAPEVGQAIYTCVRFTSLPGTCQYAKSAGVSPEGVAAFRGTYADTCDVTIEDGASHVNVTCKTKVEYGCSEPGIGGPKIDETNSNKTLTGDETSIVGLGNQEWKVGTGLCDSAFANATKS